MRQDAIFHSTATAKCVTTSDDLTIWNYVIKLAVYHPGLYLNFQTQSIAEHWNLVYN
jgi:hypothetical protein